MSTDEREIFQYLKTWGADFASAKEIARRAGGRKKFHDDPDWAKPLLIGLQQRGIIESDSLGRYRIKPVSKKDTRPSGSSPDIAAILKESGVPDEEPGVAGTDDDYEQL
ncbi:MAG: hypothetical protein ACREFE_09100 [Limisphaerales bacterium]